MSRFHYRGTGKGLLVIGDDGQKLDVGPLAKLECSVPDCEGVAARLVRTGPSTWRTLCDAHKHEVDW